MPDTQHKPKLTTRMEFMLTLECQWGCQDCCRGLEAAQPKGSHVTPEQAHGFVAHLREQEIYLTRLKVHGGEPVKNPWFEEIISYFGEQIGEYADGKLFRGVKVQTAYPKRAVLAKYNIAWGNGLNLHCEPVDARGYKGHHVPWFVSPVDAGLLRPDDVPPEGTALTGRACELQRRCGRSFEVYGFTACAQEAVIGRVLEIAPYSHEFKQWGDPAICRHCPFSLGKHGAKALQQRAMDGEFPRVTESLKALEDTPQNIVQLQRIYGEVSERQPAWKPEIKQGQDNGPNAEAVGLVDASVL